jgi:hypothetical protein
VPFLALMSKSVIRGVPRDFTDFQNLCIRVSRDVTDFQKLCICVSRDVTDFQNLCIRVFHDYRFLSFSI